MAITYAVPLTFDQLTLLRQRLSSAGPGSPAVDSELDAMLYSAQVIVRTQENEEGRHDDGSY
jgi:hypothetical protein